MNRKEWLIATILTLITVCAWVIFDVIHARAQVQISPKIQQLIQPINPDFNTKNI